jgi:hypothetical protein
VKKPAQINGRFTVTGPVVPNWTRADYADETAAMRSEVWPAVQKFLAENYPGYGAAFKADDIAVCTHCRGEFEAMTAEEAADDSTNQDEHSVEGEPVCCYAAIAEFRAERGIPALPPREKATAPAATATPHSDADRERLAHLRRVTAEWQGEWTTRRAQHVYAAAYGPGDWRRAARRDLAALHTEGLLVLHDVKGRRHYTFNSRNGGAK